MKAKKFPKLNTDAKMIKFVDGHDMSVYFGQGAKLDDSIVLAPELVERIRARSKKRLISLRLPEWQLQGAKKVASLRHLPYQALMRLWVAEGLKREFRSLKAASR